MKEENGEELLKISIDRAYNSIRHFFNLLDLDFNLYESFYNIEIVIDRDNMEKNDIAYKNDDGKPKIYISLRYLNKEYNNIIDSKITRQEAIDKIANKIIKEILYINRNDIDGLANNSIMDIHGHNKDFFNELLEESINNGSYYIYSRYVPIYKEEISPELCDVVVYDKETLSFNLHANISFEYMKVGSSLNDLLSIGLELNSNSFEYKPSATYSNKGSYSKLKELIIIILSKLILFSRKLSNIDLTKFYNSLDYITYENIKTIIAFFCNFSKEEIKWFMLLPYNESSDDRLYKSFQEDYYKLISMLEVQEKDKQNQKILNI